MATSTSSGCGIARRTLDFAAQVRARAVVMHLGSVRFFWINPGRQLRNFTRAHPAAALPADARYQQLLAKAADKLRKRQPAFWEQTRRSLAELLPYAAEKGVRLGLENREKFEELPRDADFPGFLDSLRAGAGRLLARHGPRRVEGADGRNHTAAPAAGGKRGAADRLPPARRG